MAQTFEFRDELAFPADKVMEKMLDLSFIEEWTIVQKGLNPRLSFGEKTDTKAVILLDLEEPLPKPLGTVKAHMEFTWDILAKRMTWKRVAEGMASKANISGVTEVLPNGDAASTFVESINIDIPIPVMGKKFEKLVAGYLRDGRPEKISFLRRRLSE